MFILTFRKKLHWFFFASSCHCLISLKTLSSIPCFLCGESLFVDALCSCAVLRAPLKQKKLGYQWKSAEYYNFFLMFSPLFFEMFSLHAPSPLILLPPSILCLPPTKKSTTKTSLLRKTMVRHIKSLFFNVNRMLFFFPIAFYWVEFYFTEIFFWASQEQLKNLYWSAEVFKLKYIWEMYFNTSIFKDWRLVNLQRRRAKQT